MGRGAAILYTGFTQWVTNYCKSILLDTILLHGYIDTPAHTKTMISFLIYLRYNIISYKNVILIILCITISIFTVSWVTNYLHDEEIINKIRLQLI